MLEFRQRLLLSTALTLSLCSSSGIQAFAAEKETQTEATVEVQHVTAPVPGNAPIQLLKPDANKDAKDDDDQSAPFPKESDEAIKKANELHAQASDQLKKNNLEQAIKLDEEAAKIAPHYWMPHIALAYLYSNYKGGGPALDQASLAVKCEHPGMADTTYAALVGSMHALTPAMEKYKELVAKDPTSWRAKLGLASCYLQKSDAKAATALLDELNNANEKDPVALLVMGNYYKRANQPEKAKEVLKRGLDNNPDSKIKEKLLAQLFEIAVNTDDRALITELKPRVAPILDSRQRSWFRTGNVKLAQNPAEAKLALQLAEGETVTDTEYRSYAKIFCEMAKANPTDQTAWLKLAKEALTQAVASHPADLQNKTLLAAIDEQLGDKSEALKVMKAPTPTTSQETEQDQYLAGYYKKLHKAQDDAIAKLIVADKAGYKSFAKAVDFKIPQANCKCKVNSAKSMMKGIAGVMDVVIGPGDSPTSTVIFDGRKVTQSGIFENPKIKNFKEKIVVSNERPVTSIVELAEIYAGEEQYPIAQSPSVALVVLQYPTADDALAAVSVGSNSQSN